MEQHPLPFLGGVPHDVQRDRGLAVPRTARDHHQLARREPPTHQLVREIRIRHRDHVTHGVAALAGLKPGEPIRQSGDSGRVHYQPARCCRPHPGPLHQSSTSAPAACWPNWAMRPSLDQPA